MLELFNKYKKNNEISKAILIINNLFNKNPNNSEIFEEYFNLLYFLAENLPNLAEKKDCINQLEVILSFYSENTELNEDVVSKIDILKQKIENVKKIISDIEEKEYSKLQKNIQLENRKILEKLFNMKEKILKTNDQKELEEKLLEISKLDEKIDKDLLTELQSQNYDNLTKLYGEIINKKMQEFEYKNNVSYNKSAIQDFEKAFTLFKDNEEKYRNKAQLYGLVSKTLFIYEVSRLFNETLVYYNYVYNYIFNKLDDEGKINLTYFSIENEVKNKC